MGPHTLGRAIKTPLRPSPQLHAYGFTRLETRVVEGRLEDQGGQLDKTSITGFDWQFESVATLTQPEVLRFWSLAWILSGRLGVASSTQPPVSSLQPQPAAPSLQPPAPAPSPQPPISSLNLLPPLSSPQPPVSNLQPQPAAPSLQPPAPAPSLHSPAPNLQSPTSNPQPPASASRPQPLASTLLQSPTSSLQPPIPT
ncbi:classical arabinogalactan protein 9-like [Homarus americanus]|uniref:classical arabinogalactan protein 9-like n=1 Tax=Homarus americanus TaxID=6706 RepID=UPI001C48EB09|nr:classical arabinogalactan protein 9-like [Homarus americanus]